MSQPMSELSLPVFPKACSQTTFLRKSGFVTSFKYLVWETLRLRRMKAAFFSANAHESLTVILRLVDKDDDETSRWRRD